MLDLLLHWNSHHSLVTRWLSFAFIPSSSPPFVACQLAQVFAQWVTLITIIIGPFSIIGRSVAIGATMGNSSSLPRSPVAFPITFFYHRKRGIPVRTTLGSACADGQVTHRKPCSSNPLFPLLSMYAHSHTHILQAA